MRHTLRVMLETHGLPAVLETLGSVGKEMIPPERTGELKLTTVTRAALTTCEKLGEAIRWGEKQT